MSCLRFFTWSLFSINCIGSELYDYMFRKNWSGFCITCRISWFPFRSYHPQTFQTLQWGLQPSFSHQLCCMRSFYSLTLTTNDRFLRNFFMAGLFTLRVCWEEIAKEIFFFYISFWCLAWYTNLSFTPNKPTHYLIDYLLDHDDFKKVFVYSDYTSN